jgi:ABC-type multidrug transport system fused ATPase/permease subunit
MGLSSEGLNSSDDPHGGANKVSFGTTRDMLGSSFQISHVVREESDEEKDEPTDTTSNSNFNTNIHDHPKPNLLRPNLLPSIPNVSADDDAPKIFVIAESPKGSRDEMGQNKDTKDDIVDIDNKEGADDGGGVRDVEQFDTAKMPQSNELTGTSKFSLMKSEEDIFIDKVGSLRKEDQMELSFTNLRYTVPIHRTTKDQTTGKMVKEVEQKDILKNVSGILRPGRLTAIMGASGAGKVKRFIQHVQY